MASNNQSLKSVETELKNKTSADKQGISAMNKLTGTVNELTQLIRSNDAAAKEK